MFVLALLLACNPGKDSVETGDTGETDDSGDTGDTSDTADTGDSGDTGDTGAAVVPWSKDDEEALLTGIAADMRGTGAFAAQVAIWYDGEIVLNQAIGTRTVDGKEPVDTDTLFQIGSDTKKITAIALLQAVERGDLTLERSVADAIPGLSLAASPDWASGATLHELLSHQGGLYDYTPWDDAPGDDVLRDVAFGQFAGESWAMVPAGVMWNYSNPNFSVAGLADETADGRAWADIVEADVFAPLGMTRTFARQAEALGDGNVGNSYGIWAYASDPLDLFATPTYEYGEVLPSDVADNGFTRPAGLVWSTAADQARLLGFLVDGDPAVLSDALREQIVTSQVPLYPNFPYQGYGYGMFVFDGYSCDGLWCPVRMWQHGGNTLSYTSTSIILPDSRLAVSVLVNAYGVDMSRTTKVILERLAEQPAGEDWPTDLATETDHAELVGTYVDEQLGRIEITDDAGTLHAAFLDYPEDGLDGDLSMAWADEYVFSSGNLRGYDITFFADEDGVYRWIRDRLFVGTRTEG